MLHGALRVAGSRPRRRIGAIAEAGILMDAVWATAIAHAWGGPYTAMAAALLVTACAALLGESALAGLRATVLSSIGFLLLPATTVGARLAACGSLGRLAVLWGVMAIAIAIGARDERAADWSDVRAAVRAASARDLRAATTRDGALATAREAAGRLLPDWRVTVRTGQAVPEVRLARAGRQGAVAVPVVVAGVVGGAIECRRALGAGRRRHRVGLSTLDDLEMVAEGLAARLGRFPAGAAPAVDRRATTTTKALEAR